MKKAAIEKGKKVTDMERSLKKHEPERPGSLARKMLEFLGITRAYVRSIGTQEEEVIRVNLPLDYTDWRTIEAALVEAEHQKARALEQMRRQQFI